jgi:pimeloyl-ACP methyl ester carboxylesterase
MLFKIILVIIVSFAFGCGFYYFTQESMIFYPSVLPPDFKYSFPARFDELTMPVDGAAINALHFKTENPKGVILYFHGNAGNLSGWGDIAVDFTRRGYDVLIPDYRGYGKSTGKIKNEEMLHRDAAVAYNYLKEHYPEDQIVLYGRSLGTGIAVHLAQTARPRMIILESAFFSMKDIAAYHYPFILGILLDLGLKYPMHTDMWISSVACPVYLFHGTADDIVPYSSSERLLKLIRTESRLIKIPGGGHNDLSDFTLYQKELEHILK